MQTEDIKSLSTKRLFSKAENLEENNIKLLLNNKIVLNLTTLRLFSFFVSLCLKL